MPDDAATLNIPVGEPGMRGELAAVRRRAPRHLRGPTLEARQGEAERALDLREQFLAVAERLSLTSYWAAVPGDAEP